MPVRTHPPEALVSYERLTSLMRYDPDVGEFFWLVSRNCYGGGITPGVQVKGCVDRHGYKIIGIDGRRYQASRLAWFYVHKTWPVGEVDHINRNTLDNRLSNLRDALNRTLQRGNQKMRKDNRCGLKGVQWSKNEQKWRARCRSKTIGMFNTAEEAHEAYIKAAQKAFGEFARSA
jgi:hypothetical protein